MLQTLDLVSILLEVFVGVGGVYFFSFLLNKDFLPSTHLTILDTNKTSYLCTQLLSKVPLVTSENFSF